MNLIPTQLAKTPEGDLQITWSDGQLRHYTIAALRSACPCATCREKRTAATSKPPDLFTILKPEEARPLTIQGMQPVGHYAYSIAFSDGHDTGIFTLVLLRELGNVVTSTASAG
jgi:DUF971 family protein